MHIGRSKYEHSNYNKNKNYKNGYSKTNINNSFGNIYLNIPKDRGSEFKPRIVKKYETICNELDKKIINLYAHRMIISDIQVKLEDLYEIHVSSSMISKLNLKANIPNSAYLLHPPYKFLKSCLIFIMAES